MTDEPKERPATIIPKTVRAMSIHELTDEEFEELMTGGGADPQDDKQD